MVRNHNLADKDLQEKVVLELKQQLNISKFKLIKHHKIKQALPQLSNLGYEPAKLTTKNNVIFTGDTVVQGSINSAMLSGKKAAEKALELIKEV